MQFELGSLDGNARAGVLRFERGEIQTPVFMPVGTYGTVKAMTPEELVDIGVQIVLGNTYHLMLRPGTEVLKRHGGLHGFMNWPGPILTDSGGYQVFSLGHSRTISEEGVTFRSPVNGDKIFLSPEISMEVQAAMGSDIVMVFDECTPFPATIDAARASMELSLRWATRSKTAHSGADGALFGIVQGGMYSDLRHASLAGLLEIGFDGYAVGGLSVGEPKDEMYRVMRDIAEQLPADKPRYFMGVGTPEDLLEAIGCGIDMFDCVLPTRSGRTGQAFTRRGAINLRNARHAQDERPLDDACGCPTCAGYSRGYLHHLIRAKEILGAMLLTWHNLHYYQTLMRTLREAVAAGGLATVSAELRDSLAAGDMPPTGLGTAVR